MKLYLAANVQITSIVDSTIQNVKDAIIRQVVQYLIPIQTFGMNSERNMQASKQ